MGLPHFFQVRQPFLQAALAPSLFESLTKKEEHNFRYTLPFGGELGIRTLGTLRTQHFESFSQRVNFRSFRVSFRSFCLSQKPHKIRLFRP